MRVDYNKPYLLIVDPRINVKNHIFYDYKNRTTDLHIFMSGKSLPANDLGKMKYSQSPETYDLMVYSNVIDENLLSYDYFPSLLPAPIVNKRCLDILKQICGSDFQYFPITISNEHQSKKPIILINQYWLINITKTIDSIDLEKSTYCFDEYGSIDSFDSMYFKNNKFLEGQPYIARERLYPSNIVVSDFLKSEFDKHKIEGCKFITDEEYNKIIL